MALITFTPSIVDRDYTPANVTAVGQAMNITYPTDRNIPALQQPAAGWPAIVWIRLANFESSNRASSFSYDDANMSSTTSLESRIMTAALEAGFAIVDVAVTITTTGLTTGNGVAHPPGQNPGGAGTAPFDDPAWHMAIKDICYAIQHIRTDNLNIDPLKTFLGGDSAGGNTSAWVAFQQDLSSILNAAGSGDPQYNASTEVAGIICLRTPFYWKQYEQGPGGLTGKVFPDVASGPPYDTSADQLEDTFPEYQDLLAPGRVVTRFPHVWMAFNESDASKTAEASAAENQWMAVHHFNNGATLKSDHGGIEARFALYSPAFGLTSAGDGTPVQLHGAGAERLVDENNMIDTPLVLDAVLWLTQRAGIGYPNSMLSLVDIPQSTQSQGIPNNVADNIPIKAVHQAVQTGANFTPVRVLPANPNRQRGIWVSHMGSNAGLAPNESDTYYIYGDSLTLPGTGVGTPVAFGEAPFFLPGKGEFWASSSGATAGFMVIWEV